MRVIYTECSNTFWLDVAKILEKRFSWKPVYWTARPEFEAAVTERFDEVCFHSEIDAVRSIAPQQFKNLAGAVLDQPLLERLANLESYSLKMMDRMDALGTFTYQERVRHYHRLVSYWLAIIEQLQPDLVFFKTIPHMVYDFVLYDICKMLGIQTMMFEQTNVQGLAYLRSSIDGITIVQSYYQRLLEDPERDRFELSPDISAYLASLRGEYEKLPLYIRYVSKKEIYERNKFNQKIRKLFNIRNYKTIVRKQKQILSSKLSTPLNYLKPKGKTHEKAGLGGIHYRIFRYQAQRQIRNLSAYYERLATEELNLKIPYIFVGLNYQPEATTSPKGNVYVNLLLMVEMLSKVIPQEWMIYVKEHPAQFDKTWAYRAHSARTKYFYDDLISIKNVRLAPISFSSYPLIDHSIAVATATGTVGWQAVLRAKPALIFGDPWYSGCEGVHSIRSRYDFMAALEKIRNKDQVDIQKVELFAYALEKVAHRVPFGTPIETTHDVKSASAETIANAMQKHYVKSVSE